MTRKNIFTGTNTHKIYPLSRCSYSHRHPKKDYQFSISGRGLGEGRKEAKYGFGNKAKQLKNNFFGTLNVLVDGLNFFLT